MRETKKSLHSDNEWLRQRLKVVARSYQELSERNDELAASLEDVRQDHDLLRGEYEDDNAYLAEYGDTLEQKLKMSENIILGLHLLIERMEQE